MRAIVETTNHGCISKPGKSPSSCRSCPSISVHGINLPPLVLASVRAMNSAALSLASNTVRGHCDEKLLQFHERESVLFSALGHAHMTSGLDEARQAFWDNYTSIDMPTRFVIPCPLPIFQVFPQARHCS